MSKEEAINAIYSGGLVECTAEEYHNGLRSDIGRQAGQWIDQGQGMRAQMAFMEIKRLDEKFGAEVPA